MLRRLGTWAVAIVVAVLPSLNRICLTECDAEQFQLAHADRPVAPMAAPGERAGDSNCPLHASPSSPEPPARPDAPHAPAPCQHQQDIASIDHAKCLTLVPGADYSFTIVSTMTAAGPVRAVSETPSAADHPLPLRPPSNGFVLRI
jgi:hypothetical protein